MPLYQRDPDEEDFRPGFVGPSDAGRQDSWTRLRGAYWGTPGFQRRQSTVVDTSPLLGATTTYVVETVRTDQGDMIFLQIMGDRGLRIVLPDKVASVLYRQHDGIIRRAKSDRAKRAAQKRQEQGIVPFQRRAEREA